MQFLQPRLLIIAASSVVAAVGFTARPHAAAPAPAAATAPQMAAVVAPAAVPAPVATATTSKESARDAFVSGAIDALSSHVSHLSSDGALRMAFQAYYNYKAAHPQDVKQPYLYFVDYGLSNTTPRGYVFDMDKLTLVDGPFIVAHGRGSSNGKYGVPTRFSNRSGGAATSLGLYVTANSYDFSGHAGGHLYHSIGMRLKGVSGQFNSAAFARGVVMHGAPYVTATGAGRSEGCPAVDQARAHRLIPKLQNGSLVFLYSPNDSTWLAEDPWANGTN